VLPGACGFKKNKGSGGRIDNRIIILKNIVKLRILRYYSLQEGKEDHVV
jgi:hypothetical protein